jgi:UDP-N-acetylglucosamine 1-carboxyvinyltransferase
MGASIQGLETSEITIHGVKKLSGVEHAVIPDRIETGTFLIAAAITKGDITLENADLSHVTKIVQPLRAAGFSIEENGKHIRARWVKNLKPISVATDVYPAFPTDMQAQWMALMSLVNGRCKVRETVFENRFLHVQELLRFGAEIELDGRDARIKGVNHLSGCAVMVSDLRAGAALVLAGLAANGKTKVLRVYHLDRGYEKMELKLRKCGARIKRVSQ